MAGTVETEVAIVGGGVVGCAVAHALTRRGVRCTVLEAEHGLALGASGANSGILHTGFDSKPGELETRLILRSGALREELLDELGVAVWRCGARLTPHDEEQAGTVERLALNASSNGVEAQIDGDGSLRVPGEAVSDPVGIVHALAGAIQGAGSTVRLGARVTGLASTAGGELRVELADASVVRAGAVVNCAGLFADEVAAMAGERPVSVYPRKGEFLVFALAQDQPLKRILLPVPSTLGKGVLVFPTIDRRHAIAGPTARERVDKDDWSVEADARALIMEKAVRMYPPLERAVPVGAYAGLRPAGREANYVIERSRTLPALIHVAAIRSTGLSASLGIGEYVVEMLNDAGAIDPGPVRALPTPARPLASHRRTAPGGPSSSGDQPAGWWERARSHRLPETAG